MMNTAIVFAPLLAWPIIATFAALAGLLALYGILRGMRGACLRAGAWAALTLALKRCGSPPSLAI